MSFVLHRAVQFWPLAATTLMVAAASAPAGAVVTASLHSNTATSSFAGNLGGGESIDSSQSLNESTGVTFEALSRLTTTEIFFKNSVISSGFNTSATATIGVNVTIQNTYGRAFTPVLTTKLLAAGMGLFMGTIENDRYYNQSFNVSTGSFDYSIGPPANTACGAGRLKNCGPVSEALLASLTADPGMPSRSLFGTSSAGFIFDVTVGGVEAYKLSSTLMTDAAGNFSQEFSREYGAADTVLTNFRLQSGANEFARAYAWDDTLVNIRFPSVLGVGESVTATYTITTFVNLGADAAARRFLAWTFSPEQNGYVPGVDRVSVPIGYAAFADPIGNNSSIDDFSGARSFSTGPAGAINTNGTGIFDIGNIGFDPDSGEVVLSGNSIAPPADVLPYGAFNPLPGMTGVPEPSTWAMLMMGFGLVGATMRRRTRSLA